MTNAQVALLAAVKANNKGTHPHVIERQALVFLQWLKENEGGEPR